jgi:SAM-dependent methyltransferase
MNPLDKQKYIERYTQRYQQHGYNPLTLGWGKGGRQEIRFSALTNLIYSHDNVDILDVGCGFGDLYKYLKNIGWTGKYVGVDLVPILIETSQQQYPDIDTRICDILEDNFTETFDYVISSGVFNARLYGDTNQDHILAMLKRMLELARIGVAVDFMSSYVDYQHEEAYHMEPSLAIKLGMNLTRRLVFRHDYLPYEFCLYLYKESDIATNSTYLK